MKFLVDEVAVTLDLFIRALSYQMILILIQQISVGFQIGYYFHNLYIKISNLMISVIMLYEIYNIIHLLMN